MTIRTTLSRMARKVQMGMSRATVREFDDKHLIQRIKQADVYHSETPTDFERWQMAGLTAMPLKQEQDQQQQQNQNQQASSKGKANFNNNQPKGKSAEAIMLYLGGSRSLPIGIVDDPRVRPYALKEGESSFYALSGTGQMVFHNDAGSYLIATDNAQEQSQSSSGGSGGSSGSSNANRFASLRHVDVSKQTRDIKEGQQVQDHKHEGDTVNTEVRCSKSRIEFRVGDEVVGYYDKQGKTWSFIGDVVKLGDDNAQDKVYGEHQGSGLVTPKVFVNATLPGPPTSLDTQK